MNLILYVVLVEDFLKGHVWNIIRGKQKMPNLN